MSATLRWMPLDIPDYLNDTGHLTTLQHGAYLLLLMHYWRHGPLPDDDGQLAAITRTDAKTWRAIKGVIRRFFHSEHNGELHQKRADMERDKAADISAKRRGAANTRHHPPPNGPPNGDANAHANAPPQAPPNGPASAPANGGANAGPHATHNVPSTSTDSGTEETKVLIYKNSFSPNYHLGSGCSAKESDAADADRDAPRRVDRSSDPERASDDPAIAVQLRRLTSAMQMRTGDYGVVRSVEAQLDALKPQPMAVGADETMGLAWRPAEPARSPAEQYAALTGCSLDEAEAKFAAA